LAQLKDAHKSQDTASIEKALANLNAVWQSASEEMYKTAQNTGQTTSQPGPEQPGPGQAGGGSKPGDGEVTDVDFEEVK